MAFCKNCGAQMDDSAKFCSACGGAVPNQENVNAGNTNNGQQSYTVNNGNATYTGNYDISYDAQDIEQNKYLSLFAYLGILLLIPLLAEPNSRFVRFHTNQGLILLLSWMCASLLLIIPILGWLAGLALYLFNLVCLIIGVVNACNGRVKELPMIGHFRILK